MSPKIIPCISRAISTALYHACSAPLVLVTTCGSFLVAGPRLVGLGPLPRIRLLPNLMTGWFWERP
jgi:hypothetical protein